jgi:hypothetical protein
LLGAILHSAQRQVERVQAGAEDYLHQVGDLLLLLADGTYFILCMLTLFTLRFANQPL